MTEDEQLVEQWADGMAQALGSLAERGLLRVSQDEQKRPGALISDFIHFTYEGSVLYTRLSEETSSRSNPAHSIPQGDSTSMEYLYETCKWLADSGKTDLNFFEIYGLLAWGAQVVYELEIRNTEPDGWRRKVQSDHQLPDVPI
jgi:hypothetical protein